MPLKEGYSRAVIAANIQELLSSWKETGRIGNSKPKSKKEAMWQAAAIAYNKARESAKKRGVNSALIKELSRQ